MTRWFVVVTLAIALASGAAAAGPITDDMLYDQVRIKIATDREVGGGRIDVKVNNGVVELTGTVRDEKHKERVQKIVKKVKGVKAVDNKIRISPV